VSTDFPADLAAPAAAAAVDTAALPVDFAELFAAEPLWAAVLPCRVAAAFLAVAERCAFVC
jgi:hypothetical protein